MADDATAMTREKKTSVFQIRCTADWLARVQAHADALDIPIALYMRQAITERMDREGDTGFKVNRIVRTQKPPKVRKGRYHRGLD